MAMTPEPLRGSSDHTTPTLDPSSTMHPLSPTYSDASTSPSTTTSSDHSPLSDTNATLTPPTSHTPSTSLMLKLMETPYIKGPALDVRDVLAKCEDPVLGWSMQFWVTIADPLTNDVFFACPATGTCSWEPPVGAFLLPRQAQGEWWELADPNRENRSYYYNTMTSETQWVRPSGDAFVIPLGLIQQTALPARDSMLSQRTLSPTAQLRTTTPAHLSPNKREMLLPSIREPESSHTRTGPRPPPSPRRPHPENQHIISNNNNLGIQNVQVWTPQRTLGTVEEVSSTDGSPHSPYESSRPTNGRKGNGVFGLNIGQTSGSSPAQPPLTNRDGNLLPTNRPRDPIMVESMQHKRMSTGLHPLLPSNLSSQIQTFQTSEFANRYFATRRTGIRRQKVPLDRIMEWQKHPISNPILVLPSSHKEAVVAFKVIQHVMGERDKPVDGARTAKPAAWQITSPQSQSQSQSDKAVVLEEIRWLIQLAVSAKEMRDEIYCQLVKQLTKNINHDSTVLGFQLFCVLVNAFCPNTEFEPLVRTFLRRFENDEDDSVIIMANYCQSKMEALMAQGSRAKLLTIGEIEAASDAAFYPSVYGESLDRIMEFQQRSYPDLKVPVILPFLADGILALGGTSCEGIFRIPGDNESVSELKSRMDRGHYQLQGIEDPHVAASLFKLWLRELESPLIPTKQYNQCLTSSNSSTQAMEFVRQLPIINRRVLVFVITFFQLFIKPEVVQITKMTPSNLALVLAPNLLRTTSNSLVTVFTNSSFESKFVLHLLHNLRPEDVDADYIPTHGPSP